MNRGAAQDILAGMKADLDLLLMAVKAEDPYSELRIRVSDLLASAQSLTAALAAEPGAAEGWEVENRNGKQWRIVGPGGQWTMQPVGLITADEAKAICLRAAAPHQSGESSK